MKNKDRASVHIKTVRIKTGVAAGDWYSDFIAYLESLKQSGGVGGSAGGPFG